MNMLLKTEMRRPEPNRALIIVDTIPGARIASIKKNRTNYIVDKFPSWHIILPLLYCCKIQNYFTRYNITELF